MVKIIVIRFALLLSIIPFFAHEARSEEQPPPEEEQTEQTAEAKPPSINFNVEPKVLADSIEPSRVQWVDVRDNQHLLVLVESQGKKERGNILMLHAQGENPNHPRLNYPLTHQLSHLGWNIYIPHFATADFPKTIQKNSEDESVNDKDNSVQSNEDSNQQQSEQASEETKSTENQQNEVTEGIETNLPVSNYFTSQEDYQSYFLEVCQSVKDNTKISELPTAVISIQHSSFWGLSCLSTLGSVTPIIMLKPQLPFSEHDALEELLSKHSEPLYVLNTSESHPDALSVSLMRGKWGGVSQRKNSALLPSQNLPIENSSIAKSITGWIEKQRK